MRNKRKGTCEYEQVALYWRHESAAATAAVAAKNNALNAFVYV